MTQTPDREVQQWMDAWQSAVTEAAGPPEAIHRHVRRRTRLLWIWLAGEVVAVAAVTPLLVRAALVGDAIERLAMALLALIAAGAIACSWWNWHGALRVWGETTAAFLELSRRRVERFARAVVIGWVVLAAEVLVFVPWIAYRLYGRRTPATQELQIFSWGLLAALTLLGAVALVGLSLWARRERRHLDELQREIADEPMDIGAK